MFLYGGQDTDFQYDLGRKTSNVQTMRKGWIQLRRLYEDDLHRCWGRNYKAAAVQNERNLKLK